MNSDSDIIEAYKTSKSKALELLCEKYWKTLYQRASYILGQDDAEDFVQDFLIEFVYGKAGKPSIFDKFKPELNNSLHTFLAGCVKNKVIDRRRQIKRIIDPTEPINEENSYQNEGRSITDIIEEAELRSILNLVVKQLDTRCQKMIQFYHFKQLTQKETATLIGVSIGAASNLIFRCTKKFGELIKREFSRLGYEY